MEYEIIRSDRISWSIEVGFDLKVRVRAPYHASDEYIAKIVAENEKWIEERLRKNSQRSKSVHATSEEERQAYIKAAREYLPKRTEYFASLMGVSPTAISITGAQKRYGSCSGKNRICFSYLVMALPTELIDYVIAHELAHIKHHNHSLEFYEFLGKFMPDHRERQKRIKEI